MCTTILVGRERSATGRVLLAHSEELGRNSAHRVVRSEGRQAAPGESFPLHSGGSLPREGPLARHLATAIFDKRHYPGEHTSGVNAHGVAVANNMAMMRGIPEASMYDVIPGGVIWTEFLQWVLEKARSAREGVERIAGLCERHGLSCDSGTMIAVADPTEAWWVELARDGLWAAERVGDGEVSVRANCYRIGSAVLTAPRLAELAAAKGWEDPARAGFAAAVGDPANQTDRYNLDRHDLLAARVADRGTLGIDDLALLLREVYEDTPLYRVRADGSPFRTEVRTVARMNTEACAILEPAPGTAAGSRMWVCLSTSLTGAFVPFHLDAGSVHPFYATAGGSYAPDSAYWKFTELAKLADYRYPATIGAIRATWSGFESDCRRALAGLESRLAGLAVQDRFPQLEAFDREWAERARTTLEALLAQVKTLAFYEAF